MTIIHKRMCDNCKVEENTVTKRDWFRLEHKISTNTAEQYDFCCLGCLLSWVNHRINQTYKIPPTRHTHATVRKDEP